ncbi:MAG: vWA domain-containing protein [Candidatus Choladocola sp.]|nr:vWA domain-containing protein [Candidatus Choladocola sp.]
MKYMKTWLLLAVSVLCMMFGIIMVQAAGLDTSTGLDVVLVIDTSGSMNDADNVRENPDKPKTTLEGAKLFVDMMESQGSRVAVVPFSDTLGNVINLTTISQQSDKESVKNAISQLQYSGDTDFGIALRKAVEILSTANDIGNNKVIVFFTDGKIDLPKADDPALAASDSETMTRDAADTASAEGIAVYTLGLDVGDQGNVQEDLISEIASQTGGKYKKVTTSEVLPDTFCEIFADFIESSYTPLGEVTIQDSNTPAVVDVPIPNDSVMEANIAILSDKRLTNVEVEDPNGNTIPIDGQTVILSVSDTYSALKLITPQSGNWKVRIYGDENCKVTLGWMLNYKVTLKAELVDNQNGTVTVNAYFEYQNQPLQEDALYRQFATEARVDSQAKGNSNVPMTYQDGQYKFTGDIPVDAGDTITVTVFADSASANMYRESDPLTFTSEIPPTEVTCTSIPTVTLNGLIANQTKHDLNLDQYFATNTGNGLNYNVTIGDPSVADMTQNGSEINLKGNKKGTTVLTVVATDAGDGTACDPQQVQVEVKGVFGSILPLILIGVGVLLLIILIVVIIILSHRPKLDGYVYWYLEDDRTFGANTEEEFSLSFEKKRALMSIIVTDPAVTTADLDKVVIKPLKNGVTVMNNSRYCALTDGFDSETKKLTLRDGDNFAVICQTEEGEVTIACSYTLEPKDEF